MIKHALTQGWTVRPAGGNLPSSIGPEPLPATVPGTIHTDLLAAGRIDDPYYGTNESGLAWLFRSAWIYATTVAHTEDERVDLVFDGLDTVATITLGGVEIGRTANMHRSYRFDVRERLAGGPAALEVRFDSALDFAEQAEKRLGPRPKAYGHPFNAIRKMACSFGWDWGPDLQTSGIWRPARIERWRIARLAEVRPLATLDGTTGRVTVHVTTELSGLSEPKTGLRVRVTTAGISAEGDPSGPLEIAVPDAPVWWPAGYGEQPLQDVTVDLLDGDEILDTVTRRVGFRSIALDESPDDAGTRFALVVNGQPIFALGLNWIPEDHLLTRVTREDYAAAVDRAVAANANLLRVWGGGIWETDDFYDVCDERGVLVWQDFPLACAAYAEEDPLRSEMLAEARENVARISSHASLAVYNGGNENIWGHEDWDWKSRLGDLSWGAGYYYRDFPELLAELDPTRPYHPGSPSSPGFDPDVTHPNAVHPNDDRHGTRHEWQSWNERDYTWHARFTPRFCSEFGWQAPPTWATLTAALPESELRRTSPAFLLHQKAGGGNEKLDRGLAHHFAVPDGFADWHWATQLNQARATTYAIAHLRSYMPHTMGSVIWQLNDCWPVTSWAVVDGAGRRKPAWYALRRAYAPRLLEFTDRGLVAVNDTAEPWEPAVTLRRLAFDGRVLATSQSKVAIPARTVSIIELDTALTTPGDATAEVLVADGDDLRATRLFAEDRDVRYDPSPLTGRAERGPDGYRVTVTAVSFARDVALLADRVVPDATTDTMLVDLLPGESHTFHVRTNTAHTNTAHTDTAHTDTAHTDATHTDAAHTDATHTDTARTDTAHTDTVADPAAFLDPEVLRSANSLVTRG